MASHRQGRIEEEVKKELSSIIRELKDPRISGVVSVIAVDITKDLRFAKAHISVLGTDEQKQNTLKGITAASGFIRREIGHRVALRHAPEFTFKLDSSIEYGAHINKIIESVSGGKEDSDEQP